MVVWYTMKLQLNSVRNKASKHRAQHKGDIAERATSLKTRLQHKTCNSEKCIGQTIKTERNNMNAKGNMCKAERNVMGRQREIQEGRGYIKAERNNMKAKGNYVQGRKKCNGKAKGNTGRQRLLYKKRDR